MENRLIVSMVEAAVQAPSIHNTQPWRFTAHASTIDLYADRTRAVPAVDPTGRLLVLSCGSALEFLCIASCALGREPVVSVLPDPRNPDLLATVDVGGTRTPSAVDAALVDAMPHRHTARAPFADREVTDDVTGELTREAGGVGAWATVLQRRDDLLVTAVLQSHADEAERASEPYLAELAAWRRESAPDGIPAAALAPTRARASNLPLRDFTAGDAAGGDTGTGSVGDDSPAPPEEYARLLVLGTDADTPVDWVVAGRALARVWLRATTLGLAASPMTQALDSDPYRGWLRNALRYQGYPQMLLRIGYGAGPVATARRGVADVLTVTDERTPGGLR